MSTDGDDAAEIYRYANPLLTELPSGDINIQPYWIVIVQILFKQMAERTWNLFRYHVFLTTLEIGIIQNVLRLQIHACNKVLENQEYFRQQVPAELYPTLINLVQATAAKKKESDRIQERFLKKLKFDVFNILFQCLPLLGHACWYCYIQSSCPSAKNGTSWNCYNIFGYRLYNYMFVSYFSFSWVYFIKSIAHVMHPAKPRMFSLRWFEHNISLWMVRVTFVFVSALMLPYIFTHVIPMTFTYGFMTVIYVALWFAVLFSTIFLMLDIPLIRRLIPIPGVIVREHRALAAAAIVFALGTYTYPVLLSTMYNYSQFLYYGENYIETMNKEFDSRDTSAYFRLIADSINQKFHTILESI